MILIPWSDVRYWRSALVLLTSYYRHGPRRAQIADPGPAVRHRELGE